MGLLSGNPICNGKQTRSTYVRLPPCYIPMLPVFNPIVGTVGGTRPLTAISQEPAPAEMADSWRIYFPFFSPELLYSLWIQCLVYLLTFAINLVF